MLPLMYRWLVSHNYWYMIKNIYGMHFLPVYINGINSHQRLSMVVLFYYCSSRRRQTTSSRISQYIGGQNNVRISSRAGGIPGLLFLGAGPLMRQQKTPPAVLICSLYERQWKTKSLLIMKGVLKWVEKIGRYLMRPKSNMQGDAVKTESVRVKRSCLWSKTIYITTTTRDTREDSESWHQLRNTTHIFSQHDYIRFRATFRQT